MVGKGTEGLRHVLRTVLEGNGKKAKGTVKSMRTTAEETLRDYRLVRGIGKKNAATLLIPIKVRGAGGQKPRRQKTHFNPAQKRFKRQQGHQKTAGIQLAI